MGLECDNYAVRDRLIGRSGVGWLCYQDGLRAVQAVSAGSPSLGLNITLHCHYTLCLRTELTKYTSQYYLGSRSVTTNYGMVVAVTKVDRKQSQFHEIGSR